MSEVNLDLPSEIAPAARRRRNKSIPVTIVTGFLGAGKTSLLNKLTKHLQGDRRIAVIENEFGEVNLDGQLVSSQLRSKEDVVTISNGCVCCALRKDIIKALYELYKQGRQCPEGPYTNIILETTGVADPGPVAFTFFTQPWVKRHFHLDSVITVVDAKHFQAQLAALPQAHSPLVSTQHTSPVGAGSAQAQPTPHGGRGAVQGGPSMHNEVVNQVAFADLVLLNKIDMVDHACVSAVESAIRDINALATVIHTRLDTSDCPQWLSMILDNKRFTLARALEVDPSFLEPASDSEGDGSGASGSGQVPEVPTRRSSSPAAQPLNSPAPPAGSKRKADSPTLAAIVDEGPRSPRRKVRALHNSATIVSVGVTVPGELDEFRFNMFMRDLLQACGHNIYRSKGTLCIHGRSQPYVFQGVHETFQLAAQVSRCPSDTALDGISSEAPDAPKHSDLVFIGRNLDKHAIKQGLQTCVWVPLPDGWQEHKDSSSQRTFYVHAASGRKSWLRPAEVLATTSNPTSRVPGMPSSTGSMGTPAAEGA